MSLLQRASRFLVTIVIVSVSFLALFVCREAQNMINTQLQINEHGVSKAVTSVVHKLNLKDISSVDSNATASTNQPDATGDQLPNDETEAETSAIGLVQESNGDFNGTVLHVPAKKSNSIRETTRFVLFLCDAKYYKGSLALVASLAESSMSTSLPPLVMVVGNYAIQPFEQEALEFLGAQVKLVEPPQTMVNAMAHRFSGRWQGVFSKTLLFRRDIVECDIVFYIDIDTIARGNLIDCMGDIIQRFRSNPQLDIAAVGNRKYFNNGVILARPRRATFTYMVEMLRNGTCEGKCTENDYKTMMRRKVIGDQDVFIEYTEHFPERFMPVENRRLNLRPMHAKTDMYQDCSVVHYAGLPKPWESWFFLPNISTPVKGSNLRMLPDSIPKSIYQLKKRSKPWQLADWALELWRDQWNRAVTQLTASQQLRVA